MANRRQFRVQVSQDGGKWLVRERAWHEETAIAYANAMVIDRDLDGSRYFDAVRVVFGSEVVREWRDGEPADDQESPTLTERVRILEQQVQRLMEGLTSPEPNA